ncbi:MAG: helix-turn-helix domain-containing protein [Bacteroidetes bacterium]|nr:helix-turn-helix domain-containing protein [Bacteroidota bacterium]
MAANVITTEDLLVFKKDLLDDFKKLLSEKHGQPVRKWLKSHEVRRILTISPGTLQNLRVNGTLPFTKIGGVMYYNYEDIQKMLEQHNTKTRRNSSAL